MDLVEELKKASYVIPNEKEQDFLTVINLSEAIEIANRAEPMPKIVEGKSKLINIIANMVSGRIFPSPYIEDHKQKITRKYFQQILTEYDEKIKCCVQDIKKVVDNNFKP